MEIKNAVIKHAVIEIEDHGCLTAFLHLDYGVAGQGFGGFCLYSELDKTTPLKNPGNYAGNFIYRCLEVVGVSRWENLIGKTIRVKAEHCKVHAIGHIIHDIWYEPSIEMENITSAFKKGE